MSGWDEVHPMAMDADLVRHELLHHVGQAGENELRMLLYVARRWVGVGQTEYGPLKLDGSRDWAREKMEEQADRLFYDIAAEFERKRGQ